MFKQMNTFDWLCLPSEVKQKLVSLFHIKRSGYTHVSGGVVVTDGYTNEDLSALNIQSLQGHLMSTNEDFRELFIELLESLDKEEQEDEPKVPKKRGRKPKHKML